MILRPPRPTRTATLFPYPTLFRSAYDPVRGVIRQHIIETMPVGPSDHIFSIPVEARRVHSIRSAAQEAGAHPKRLRKLLHAAGYIREADMMLSDERVTFPVAEVKDYLGRIANSMSLEAAGHYLNAPRVQEIGRASCRERVWQSG